jgi:small ligand-binding sensory domain FIST
MTGFFCNGRIGSTPPDTSGPGHKHTTQPVRMTGFFCNGCIGSTPPDTSGPGRTA